VIAAPEPFEDLSRDLPHVRGVLHRAGEPPSRADVDASTSREGGPRLHDTATLTSPPGDGLVLTHGAGSNAEQPLLVALARALAEHGVSVLRCDLPFRQTRRRGPPPAGSGELDREGLRRAVQALGGLVRGRVFLGGHSYGGRQATMLAAAAPGLVAGLLLLSYPLHPPGRPSESRTAHFPDLRTPAMFVHGTDDVFGSIDEMRAALALIAAPTALMIVESGKHDLTAGRVHAATPLADRIAAEVAAWKRTVPAVE
jgi:uncharacterized protein